MQAGLPAIITAGPCHFRSSLSEELPVQSDIQCMEYRHGDTKAGLLDETHEGSHSPSARQVTRVCAFLALEWKPESNGTQPDV